MADVIKKRFFEFLVYEESAPRDWVGILRRSHCMFAISPLHRPDDECKKPHYHVIWYCGHGPVTLANAKATIPAEVPANGYIEPVRTPQGAQRYLIHLDDPEKEQFPDGINAITVLNGFPLDLRRQLSKAEQAKVRSALFEIIRENGVCEYSDFIFGLERLGDADMLDFACGHTILFSKIIDSQRNKARSKARREAAAAEAERQEKAREQARGRARKCVEDAVGPIDSAEAIARAAEAREQADETRRR